MIAQRNNFTASSDAAGTSPVAKSPAKPSHTLTGERDGEAAGGEFSPVTKCAYCNRPAVRYHAPPPMNGKAMPSIPLCGTACNAGRLTRKGSGK